MEGIPASNKTIYVDTTNVRVGISTGLPQSTLDVNGTVSISSPIYLNQSPGTIGYVLTSSGAGASPFWGPNVAAAGSGAQLASTQTFSGANTFTSTTTVGIRSAVQVLDYSSVLRGGYSEVGEYAINGATFAAFTNYNSKYPHQIKFVGSCAGAAYQMYMQVNGDFGGNGSWGGSYLCLGGGVTAAGAQNQASLEMTPSFNQDGSTSTVHLELEATPHTSGSQVLTGTVNSQWQNAAGNVNAAACSWNGYVAYNGAIAPPKTLIFNSGSASAKCNGQFWVLAFVPAVDPTQ